MFVVSVNAARYNRKSEIQDGGRQTENSYKLVTGRDVNVMSTATT